MTPYEHSIAEEVRQTPFFQVGMHVELLHIGQFGKLVAHRGFYPSIMQHCYDVLLDSGGLIFKICESDISRYVGACLRRIK